ncbi:MULTISPECIES: type IV pilus secretin PilQ [unclassified Acinetobacter]|uniref:type IV pilus secretin PilQ n=1 Tax=unclassified Acinetobacter TaxID=196816 RepID=UPI0035B872A0
MGFTMNKFAITALAMGMMQVAQAQVGITNVTSTTSTDQGTELRMAFNGLPQQPKAYQLNNPSRLVLDFEGVANKVATTDLTVGSNEVSNVVTESDSQRSRVTVNLKEFGAFTTKTEGNNLVVKVTPKLSVGSTTVNPNRQAQSIGLANIGFERGSQNEGLVNIRLLSGNTPVDVQQQGSRVVVRMLGSRVPTHLARRLNVGEFGTPVTTVDAYNEGNNGVIVIQPTGNYEYMAYQTDDRLTISVKRPADINNVVTNRAQKTYTGKKVSLDFQDIEVRRVLQLLADFTGNNIVAADSVQGQITIRLKDVPWDQALDVIMKTKGLDKRQNGNVIQVAPVAELLKTEKEEADMRAQSARQIPIQTDYIKLNYAKASAVLKLLTDVRANNDKSREATNAGNGNPADNLSLDTLLSPRGSAVSDDRTNTLIINDTAQNIDKVRKMLSLVDVPLRQVMIEVRIVRATNEFTKNLGVRWGVFTPSAGGRNSLVVGGSTRSLGDLANGGGSRAPSGAELMNNLNVDLGIANAAGRVAFGLLRLSDLALDLELSAAQADGLTEIVSTPKVLTADKQKATIKSGTQIPYQTMSNVGGVAMATVSFKDAVLLLDVTPSITPEGKIGMELNINKDSIGTTAENGELTVDTNHINTNVLVGNGETIVLGGVFESTNSSRVTKVPVLGDLPVVGSLFKRTQKVDNRNELLVFVTPRIVADNSVNR